MPSWNERIMLTRRGGQPALASIFRRPSRLTESEVFVRSTKTMKSSMFCSSCVLLSCLVENRILVVPREVWNPHWLLGTTSTVTVAVRRLMIILATILPAVARSEMPWWLLQMCLLPLCLKRCTSRASLNSCGTASLSQITLKTAMSIP